MPPSDGGLTFTAVIRRLDRANGFATQLAEMMSRPLILTITNYLIAKIVALGSQHEMRRIYAGRFIARVPHHHPVMRWMIWNRSVRQLIGNAVGFGCLAAQPNNTVAMLVQSAAKIMAVAERYEDNRRGNTLRRRLQFFGLGETARKQRSHPRSGCAPGVRGFSARACLHQPFAGCNPFLTQHAEHDDVGGNAAHLARLAADALVYEAELAAIVRGAR